MSREKIPEPGMGNKNDKDKLDCTATPALLGTTSLTNRCDWEITKARFNMSKSEVSVNRDKEKLKNLLALLAKIGLK